MWTFDLVNQKFKCLDILSKLRTLFDNRHYFCLQPHCDLLVNQSLLLLELCTAEPHGYHSVQRTLGVFVYTYLT